MDIDTRSIRRLRDALLSGLPQDDAVVPAPGAGSAYRAALLRRLEPFAETMFLVMVADGDLAEVERGMLAGAVAILAEGCLDSAGVAEMLDRFSGRLAAGSIEGRLAQLGAGFGSDRQDRETAFTLAAAMALADDRVHGLENQTLALVQEHFGISSRRVRALVDSVG